MVKKAEEYAFSSCVDACKMGYIYSSEHLKLRNMENVFWKKIRFLFSPGESVEQNLQIFFNGGQ